MKTTLLGHTVKAPTEYAYGYILITNKYSLADIITARKNGKKIVFFGSTPESWLYWQILRKNGIKADYGCDVHCEYSYDNYGLPMRPYWELLAEKDKYYFIITIPQRHRVPGVMKQLFYAGLDEFGIMYSEWSKDFASKWQAALQSAFYESIDEVFAPETLFGAYSRVENLRRTALEGAGFWDVLYMSIYKLGRRAAQLKYLEIGAGTGIMSFALKKLLGEKISIDWLDVPVKETYWQENSTGHFQELMKKYGVRQFHGYVETDESFPTGMAQKKYDCIVLAQVMEHFIFRPSDVFRRLADLLTPKGMIYVAVPNDYRFYNVRSWKEMPSAAELDQAARERRIAINDFGHFHEYSKEQAEEVFEAAALETIYYRWNSPINFFMLRKKMVSSPVNSFVKYS